MIFNPSLPLVGQTLTLDESMPREWRYFGINLQKSQTSHLFVNNSFKYASIEYAMKNSNDLVTHIIKQAPLSNKHKRVVVDVKYHYMRRGHYACIPGWHLDGSENTRGLDKKPELHHLFVAGDHALTEFISHPVDIPIPENTKFSTISKEVGAALDQLNVGVFQVPNCRFVTYDDKYFHRAGKAVDNGPRILVRLTETDVIEPRNVEITTELYS
jgi:hypothetical protein